MNKEATATLLGSSLNPAIVGYSVTFTATIVPAVAGLIGGTVTFKDGSTTLGSGSFNSSTNKATLVTSKLAAGTHHITASYGGSPNCAARTSAVLTETVDKAAIAMAMDLQH